MDNFRKKFIEEAYEHINEIEQALLVLERDPENKELIEKVFRAMHSLKGGGAMFGFDRVSEFTHNLENVYDLVRNGQMYVSKELLDVTLQSVDHLKNLLNDDNVEDETVVNQHAALSNQIQKIIDEKVALTQNTEAKKDISAATQAKDVDSQCNTFYIHFLPNESIFDNGTNPLYLIDELHALGECIVLPHFDKIPPYDNYKPTSCYIYWEVYLATKSNINAISDVFIFVEDECKIDIQKLSDTNLLKNKEFVDNIHAQYNKGKEADVLQLHQYSASAEIQDAKESGTAVKTSEKNVVSAKSNTISSIRVSSEKLDNLMNLVSELVTTQARLSLYADQDNNPELIAIAENVQKLSRQLRDTAFSIVLIPIENLMTRFQRLVRDLSQDLSKEVQFIAEGTETELDKTIIENLTDPLLHI
ncbi:MAG TPA: Hpt domain-containing protein, partial [Bacteroidales bacterium]